MQNAINIIFDGPPSHESGRFVGVETDDGKSINAGEWIERGDGLWALRITSLPEFASKQADSADTEYPHKDCFYSGGRGCSNLNLNAKLRR